MAGRKPTVHVLLATFNGARYLAQQWASLEAQEGVDVVLHIADDGSTDGTPALLEQLESRRAGAITQVTWLHEPARQSATRSFLLLVSHVVETFPQACWFAYCDQDDIWLPGKLASALALLPEAQELPALYGGRTVNVDERDTELGLSPLFAQVPCFRNALVQNIMGGNTMVMNRPAAERVARCAQTDVPLHDWFTYQLVSGAGGVVVYDARAFVRYRQHAANVIGSTDGWAARWRKLKRIYGSQFQASNARNVAALAASADVLADDAADVLRAFEKARMARGSFARLRWLRRSGVFRQPASQQLALLAACWLGRI